MKKREIKSYEYIYTEEEISMIMDICAMCLKSDIHSLGNHRSYYDRIKENANHIYNETINSMGFYVKKR